MKVIRGGKHRNAKATNFKVEFRQIDNIWWVSSLKEKKVSIELTLFLQYR